MRSTAEDLSSRGYVSASVVYFGVSGTPPTLVDVPVEIAGRALSALALRADVDTSRLAVMGSSKGGEYALLVASTYPQVKAVVSLVPSPFAWFGLGEGSMPTGCAWSSDGKSLPCVPQDERAAEELGALFASQHAVAFRASYERSRANGAAVRAAFFPLERIRGPVLCLAGADDQMWNSEVQCEMAMSYLREHHHPYSDRMVSYPDAGHVFIVAKNGPASALNSVEFGSFEMRFGGTPESDARAASAAWAAIAEFLAAAFG